MTDEFGPQIVKRLDVTIALLLRLVGSDGHSLSTREQISALSRLGLRPVEIAGILGKSGTYVNKELSGLRKKGGN
jgi:DNA-binding CsgD family transcriptional regulator